jgi:putative DNA methylase
MSVGDRMIDRWFPCNAVDDSVGTPFGSGKNEKAIFPWFASRPIAQARAAVLAALLPDRHDLRPLVERALRDGDRETLDKLAAAIQEHHSGTPALLDTFSGRAIISLEAARLGVRAVGLDYSPVATLAGRLLAEYPLRDWSDEGAVPFEPVDEGRLPLGTARLAADVEIVLAEVERRTRLRVADHYPRNPDGTYPWGYVWAITIPCEKCQRRFPLVGSLALRHPYKRTRDEGQGAAFDH